MKINTNKNDKFDYKKILNQDFVISMPGYNTTDVDYFLDEIILDYKNKNEMFEQINFDNDTNLSIIDNLQNKITNLEMANKLLKEQLKDLDNKGYNNLEILKRLSNLEEAMNGQDNKIQEESFEE